MLLAARFLTHALSPRFAGAALLLLSTVLAGTARAEPPPPVIRFGVSTAGVGDPPRVNTGWLSVAQTRRFLEDEFKADGIKVEWLFFKGQGPAVNEALANHQLDFTTLGDLPSIIGRSVGIQARVVMSTSRGANTYVGVQPGSAIRGIADLRGKRIGFHKGTATQLAVDRILERHGLTEKDVKVVNLEPATSLAAFQSGDLDALFTTLQLLNLQDKGVARIIYSTHDTPTTGSGGNILVTDRFAQAHPELTQRVVTALVKAAHHASLPANRGEVLKLWASAGSVTAAQYEADMKGQPLTYRLSPRFDPFIVASDRKSVDDALRFKLIRKSFDVGAWIDDRYVENAVKQLKLESFWPAFDANGAILPQP